MKKNVIIIAGSPRQNGNSDLLADQFAQGAMAQGHNVEVVHLRKLKLSYCLGCYHCSNEGQCVHNDGVDAVLKKMMASDVIVFSSPVYFYSVTGQMKVFLDRTLPIYGELANKELYYMVTAQHDDRAQLDRAMDVFNGWADCFEGMTVKGKVYGGNTDERGDVKETPAFERAYELGANV